MKLWNAMKRLNQRYGAWQANAAARLVAALDRPAKPATAKHIALRDLLSRK
jgi:hypothetical protein